jgi:hypothetical protein
MLVSEVAVGTIIADRHRVAKGSHPPPAPTEPSVQISRTGLVRVDSQYGDSLQLLVGVMQLWSKQWELFSDPVELLPTDRAMPAPTTQHFAPVVFNGPMNPQQCPKISGNAVVCIVTTEHLIEMSHLFL